jgi:hypothetical protein
MVFIVIKVLIIYTTMVCVVHAKPFLSPKNVYCCRFSFLDQLLTSYSSWFFYFLKKKIIVRMWDQRVDVAYIGSKCFTTHYFVCFPQLYPMNNLYRKVCSKKKPICKGSKLDSSEPQRDVLLSNVAKAVSSDI